MSMKALNHGIYDDSVVQGLGSPEDLSKTNMDQILQTGLDNTKLDVLGGIPDKE